MSELLLEIFCEEIPARMQAKAEADLLAAIIGKLDDAGLVHGEAFGWSGPRRLGVSVADVASKSDDVREERKGPKVGAPEKAVAGFLRGAGLASIDDAAIRSDPKKGEFYAAIIETPGRTAKDIIAEAVPEIIRGFHWPKSMRTGDGELRWVRPLQAITCVLGGKTVAFEIGGIKSGNSVEGHRVHGRGPYKVKGWDDYCETLEGVGHVQLTRNKRRALIEAQIDKLCEDNGLELVEDKGLLEEVVGLAEYPVALLGDMDPAFLELPPEVIQLSMRTHQKYFAVRDPKTGKLAPHFIVIANIDAPDGGATIAAGNGKVLSARLDDGRFFWDNDKRTGLEAMAPKLATIAFKKELGSIGDKVERVAALARELAPKVGANADLAETAARLCKADLVSEMVYEFPELQGVMGRYYALEAGCAPSEPHARPTSPAGGEGSPNESAVSSSPARGGSGPEGVDGGILAGLSAAEITQVAGAIADHYKPQGPSDAVPTDPVAIAVALADKLDTLVGFWAFNQKPTGSKDPFALRRVSLGVVRLILENSLRIKLTPWICHVHQCVPKGVGELIRQSLQIEERFDRKWLSDTFTMSLATSDVVFRNYRGKQFFFGINMGDEHPVDNLLAFFADRLKQVLRDQGKRHDLIDAIFALGEDDLLLITRRVEALTTFLASDDGANLLVAYKRAANILKAEEKKDGREYTDHPTPAIMTDDTEHALLSAIESANAEVDGALANEHFDHAMAALAHLRKPADAFFESVMVNTDDGDVRTNRLNLLASLRAAMHKVADFSRIEG